MMIALLVLSHHVLQVAFLNVMVFGSGLSLILHLLRVIWVQSNAALTVQGYVRWLSRPLISRSLYRLLVVLGLFLGFHNIKVMLILLARGILGGMNNFLLFTSLQLLLNQDTCVLVRIQSLRIAPWLSIAPGAASMVPSLLTWFTLVVRWLPYNRLLQLKHVSALRGRRHCGRCSRHQTLGALNLVSAYFLDILLITTAVCELLDQVPKVAIT